MSSDADAASAAATVALYEGLYPDKSCAVAASVVFIYDSFLTFNREVACFWTRKRTGAAFLFFANKSLHITVYILFMVELAHFPSDKSCSLFVTVLWALLVLLFVPGAAFSALRVYVLSRSKYLGLLVFVLSLGPVGPNLVQYAHQFSGENSPFGCLESYNTTPALDIRLVLSSRIPLIVADMILIYITWTKLRNRAALTDGRQRKRLSLSEVLFRSGILYFVVLFALNVVHLVLSVNSLAGVGSTVGSLVTTFTAPITGILVSRFLLQLQEADRMIVMLDPQDSLLSSRDPYNYTNSFISSLGGFINPEHSGRSGDDDGIDLPVCSPAE